MKKNALKIIQLHYEVPSGEIGSEELVSREEFFFDADGHKLREETYGPGGDIEISCVLYPEKRQLEIVRYNANGYPTVESRCFYDSQDRVVEKYKYRPGMELITVCTYFYNKKGLPTEKKYRDSRGKEIECVKYAYDRWGNRIEKTRLYSETLLNSRTSYAYDKAGNLLEESYYDTRENRMERVCYAYDKYGECTRKEFYDLNDTLYLIEEYLLEYDGHGSWVRMETYRQGREEIADFAYRDRMEEKELAGITVREIVYY